MKLLTFAAELIEGRVDSLKVIVPNGCVLGVVTLTRMESLLKIALLLLTLAYTAWQWRRDAKTRRNGKGRTHDG